MPRRPIRLVLYAAGARGIGQTVRAVRLARCVESLLADGAALTIATGVPGAHELMGSPRCRLVPLPELVHLTGLVRAGTPAGQLEPAKVAAASALTVLMTEIRPDVLVTTSHRGVAGELSSVLRLARGCGIRTVLTLRDIYHPPSYEEDFASLSTDDFDTVLVAAPEQVRPYLPHGIANGLLSEYMVFTGYLAPLLGAAPTPQPLSRLSHGREILCQVGGGADGRAFLEGVFAAMPLVRAATPHEVTLRVATGPLMSEQDVVAVTAGSERLTIVQRWRPPTWQIYPDPVGPQQIQISMAGYNSSVEAAWSALPSILIPRVDPLDQEQEIRAGLFARWFGNIATGTLACVEETAELITRVLNGKLARAHHEADGRNRMFAQAKEVASALLGVRLS